MKRWRGGKREGGKNEKGEGNWRKMREVGRMKGKNGRGRREEKRDEGRRSRSEKERE